MVYFYESKPNPYGETYQLVVGKDKFENDLLVKWGYKELNYWWFHADKYSSGHIYLKLKSHEKTIDDVPEDVINDCLQLCKSQSIQGNKLPECVIIITPWTNLRKNKFMKPGEVSFKTTKNCYRKKCFNRDNKILNRLMKTRVEYVTDDIKELDSFLNEAKKSKDGDYFLKFIAKNKDQLLLKEKERKQAKKSAKKNKKKNEDWEEEEEKVELCNKNDIGSSNHLDCSSNPNCVSTGL